MSERRRNVLITLGTLLLVAGIVLILIGRSGLAWICFIGGGVVLGIWGPPTDPGIPIHGAGDST
ncbi:MAG: hypothetical protein AB7L66_16190 [Gemmatimonadales bacterium]